MHRASASWAFSIRDLCLIKNKTQVGFLTEEDAARARDEEIRSNYRGDRRFPGFMNFAIEGSGEKQWNIRRKESRFQDIIEAMEDYNKTTGATKPIPQKYIVPDDAARHANMKLGDSVSNIRNKGAHLKNISEEEKQERLKA